MMNEMPENGHFRLRRRGRNNAVADLALVVGLMMLLPGTGSAQMGMGDPMGAGNEPPSVDAETLPSVRKNIADDPVKVFEQAERSYGRRDWPMAISHYQHIRDRFPYQLEMAATAELRLADIAFARGRWAEARVLYRNFIRFRPSHPKIDYASLRIGLAAYREIPGEIFLHPPAVERDQSEAREALSLLRDFVRNFPNSEYVSEAQEAIAKCEDFLAGHELYVARFYTSRKKWRGVVMRVDTLMRAFPNSEVVPEALVLAVRAHHALGEIDKAEAVIAEMEHREIDKKLIQRARSYLAKKSS